MSFDDEKIAWAAGLFEGEGTMVYADNGFQLRVHMTDLDVLENLLEVVGVGKIYGPHAYPRTDGAVRKPSWIWICRGKAVKPLMRDFAPWLGRRRTGRARQMGLLE